MTPQARMRQFKSISRRYIRIKLTRPGSKWVLCPRQHPLHHSHVYLATRGHAHAALSLPLVQSRCNDRTLAFPRPPSRVLLTKAYIDQRAPGLAPGLRRLEPGLRLWRDDQDRARFRNDRSAGRRRRDGALPEHRRGGDGLWRHGREVRQVPRVGRTELSRAAVVLLQSAAERFWLGGRARWWRWRGDGVWDERQRDEPEEWWRADLVRDQCPTAVPRSSDLGGVAARPSLRMIFLHLFDT